MRVGGKSRGMKSKANSILIGIGASVAVTLIITAIIAYLVSSETLGQAAIGTVRYAVILIATAVGAYAASGILKMNRILVSSITAAGYFLVLLLCNVLAFGGEFSGFWITFLMVLIGLGISLLPIMHKKGSKRKYKIHAYR